MPLGTCTQIEPHAFEARCEACDAHIQWVSRSTLAERQVRQEKARLDAMAQLPVTERQWRMLRYLGDTTSSPANRAEAHKRISALLEDGTEDAGTDPLKGQDDDQG